MEEIQSGNGRFLLEFRVEEDGYGAVLCQEYTLTERETGGPDTPNLQPIYRCEYIDLLVVKGVTGERVASAVIDATAVVHVCRVPKDAVDIVAQNIFQRQGGSLSKIQKENAISRIF